MNSFKIYKLTFPNEKIYIGQTRRSIKQRLYEHKTDKRKKTVIKHAIKKYGFDNIEVEVLYDNLTLEQANQKEKELINNTKDFNYNVAEGGGHNRYKDIDYRLKLSLSQKGKPRWTEKDKERIRQQKLGLKQSKESNELRRKKSSKKWIYNNQVIIDLYSFCKKNKISYWTTRKEAKQI